MGKKEEQKYPELKDTDLKSKSRGICAELLEDHAEVSVKIKEYNDLIKPLDEKKKSLNEQIAKYYDKGNVKKGIFHPDYGSFVRIQSERETTIAPKDLRLLLLEHGLKPIKVKKIMGKAVRIAESDYVRHYPL